MEGEGECGPEQDGGDGTPGAGAGLEEASAEEGGDGPGPGGFLHGLHGKNARFGRSLSLLIRVSAAIGAEAAEVFEDFGVEDRRADFVDARGPFAEIDFAAAVAAEGEVFVAGWTIIWQVGQRRSLTDFFREGMRVADLVQWYSGVGMWAWDSWYPTHRQKRF
jgi:hypothetical protein